jgi:hypothetical protein
LRKIYDADELNMERSFREILTQMLDQESEAQGQFVSPAYSPSETIEFTFSWNPSNVQFAPSFKQSTYRTFKKAAQRESAAEVQTRQNETAPAETVILLTHLCAQDLSDAETLLRLGATELEKGISLGLLKKAYRRLAKTYHPDSMLRKSSETFLKLKATHDRLLKSLKKITP